RRLAQLRAPARHAPGSHLQGHALSDRLGEQQPQMSAEKKLKELAIPLAPVTPPVANYVNAVRTGNLLFLAGKGPAGGVTGVVGKDTTGGEAHGQWRPNG